jgi:hypothetical protein
LTHPHYGRSLLNLNGQLTNTRRSDGDPEPEGCIKTVARKKIIHNRQLYIDRPDPIAFMPVAVDTSGCIYDDFLRLLFLHAHREASALANDIPEESGHSRFLRAACLANIKGSVGLILTKPSDMRISIPLDLSSRPFISPPRFLRLSWRRLHAVRMHTRRSLGRHDYTHSIELSTLHIHVFPSTQNVIIHRVTLVKQV